MRKKKIRISHFPQVGYNKAFTVEVDSLKDAKLLCDVLVKYDIYQVNNRFRSVLESGTVVEEWSEENNEWNYWMDKETGIDDIHEYFNHLREKQEE